MDRFLGRLAINSAAILIASAGFCVALTFLIIALYLGLAEMMAPWMAALLTALAAAVLGVLALWIGRLASRSTVTAAEKARHRSTAELGELFGRQAHVFLNTNSPLLLTGLTAVGFALGFSPRLRKLLMKLL